MEIRQQVRSCCVAVVVVIVFVLVSHVCFLKRLQASFMVARWEVFLTYLFACFGCLVCFVARLTGAHAGQVKCCQARKTPAYSVSCFLQCTVASSQRLRQCNVMYPACGRKGHTGESKNMCNPAQIFFETVFFRVISACIDRCRGSKSDGMGWDGMRTRRNDRRSTRLGFSLSPQPLP